MALQRQERERRAQVFTAYTKAKETAAEIYGESGKAVMGGLIGSLLENKIIHFLHIVAPIPDERVKAISANTVKIAKQAEEGLLDRYRKRITSKELQDAKKVADQLYADCKQKLQKQGFELELEEFETEVSDILEKKERILDAMEDVYTDFKERNQNSFIAQKIAEILKGKFKKSFREEEWQPLIEEVMKNPDAFAKTTAPFYIPPEFVPPSLGGKPEIPQPPPLPYSKKPTR